MAPSTLAPRQTFRNVLAQAAAQARALLPASTNGRIESAVKLVLQADVVFNSDGTATVGSSSDPMKTYTLVGAACDCQDFAYGQAPGGFCQHRIAANLQRSVERVLARQAEPEPEVEMPTDFEPYPDNDTDIEEVEMAPTPAPAPLPEAAFSLTLKGTLDGQEALLTARGATADEFRRNLAAIRGLLDPRPQPPALAPSPATTTAPQCPTHGAAKASTKGQGWYCPHKRDDGTWCPWKSKGGQS